MIDSMFLSIVLIGLCLVLSLTLGWDALSCLNLWASRIKIGRWNDRRKWREAVARKARRWLDHTPMVPISDNRRYRILNVLKGQHRSRNIQSWQIGGLLLGLDEEDAQKYVRCHPVSFDMDSFSPDCAFYAYALKVKGVLPVSEENKIISFYTGHYKEGTVPYCDSRSDIRYVDTIGMLCPLLYLLGLDNLADRQIAEFDRALIEGVFPFHALDPILGRPLGAHDWGRGCGWYILGLTGTVTNIDRVLALAEKLLALQRSEGGFGCFLFDESSRLDSSATVLAGHLFVSAYKHSGDDRFLNAAKRSEYALMKMTRRDGTVDHAQGDTKGIGIYSSLFDRMPFVQGLALCLSSDLETVRNYDC